MSLIADILPMSHIVLDLEVGSKKRIFEQVGELLEQENGLSRAEVFECLLAREKLGTTGLGHGVAIPHGRHKAVKNALGVFIRMKNPVSFDAPDGQPVSLVFVMLVPENACGSHLDILSELAALFSAKRTRDALMAAETKEAVHRIFSA